MILEISKEGLESNKALIESNAELKALLQQILVQLFKENDSKKG